MKRGIYDISFLKDYLDLKQIKVSTLIKATNIDYTTLKRCLSGESKITANNLDRILKVFHVANYDELKNLVETDKCVAKESIDLASSYDISFLKKYIVAKGITFKTISKIIEVNYSHSSNISKLKINDKQLKSILEYFNVSTYEELKELVDREAPNEDVCELYDISFLKDYIDLKQIKQSSLVKATGISRQLISKYLKGEYKVKYNTLEKILKVFNVSTYEELKQLAETDKCVTKESIDVASNYDLSFLKEYFKKHNISSVKILKLTSVSDNVSYNTNLINVSDEKLREFLKLFKVSTYEELKQLVEDDVDPITRCNEDIYISYDISFLKEYLDKNKLTISSFADAIDSYESGASYILSGKKTISYKKLQRILKVFNVSTYNELKELVSNNQKIEDNSILKTRKIRYYEEGKDYSFLKDYFEIMNLTQKDFSNKIQCGRSNFSGVLNGKRKIGKISESKILNEFNLESKEELELLVKLLKLRQNSEVLNIDTDSNLLRNTYSNIRLNNEDVDLVKLLEVLEKYQITEEEYNIIYLLFNYDRKYTPNEISKILNIDISIVFKIYSDCIQIYLENIYTGYDYDKKYIR